MKRNVLVRSLVYCGFIISYLVLLKPSVTKSYLAQNPIGISGKLIVLLENVASPSEQAKGNSFVFRRRVQWNPSSSQVGGSFLSFHC